MSRKVILSQNNGDELLKVYPTIDAFEFHYGIKIENFKEDSLIYIDGEPFLIKDVDQVDGIIQLNVEMIKI